MLSDQEIKKLQKYYRVETNIKRKIKELIDKCGHSDYTVTDNWNDHDGWSHVTVNWYETRQCNICGYIGTTHVGRSEE